MDSAGEQRKPTSDFLWGAATSAYQVEGGYNGEGEPQTNWGVAERHHAVIRVGQAADFWNRYAADFELCRMLGLNAFRMGVEWSRIQPSRALEPGPHDPPPFDEAALEHYGKILAACRRSGLEPVVTLHHFVHPLWLGSDAWLKPNVIPLFEAYIDRTLRFLNSYLVGLGLAPIRFFITINEPNMLVLNTYFGNQFPKRAHGGFHAISSAYNHLMAAHVVAYNKIHDLYAEQGWPEPWVTLNNYCSDLYWADKMVLDLLMVRERNIQRNDITTYILRQADAFDSAFYAARIPLHHDLPYYFGAISKRITNWIGYRVFDSETYGFFLNTLEKASRPRTMDYVGLDYYDPFIAHNFRLPVVWDHEFKNKSVRSWIMNTITSKWWDWRVLPRGLHFFCKYYSDDLGSKPVLIAENGMALRRRSDNRNSWRRDKMTRSQFLRVHVHEVTKIVNDNVPLFGYLHWSLVDNYEWGTFTPRFGLFSIDHQHGLDRMETDHIDDRPSETYAALIREARSKMHWPG